MLLFTSRFLRNRDHRSNDRSRTKKQKHQQTNNNAAAQAQYLAQYIVRYIAAFTKTETMRIDLGNYQFFSPTAAYYERILRGFAEFSTEANSTIKIMERSAYINK